MSSVCVIDEPGLRRESADGTGITGKESVPAGRRHARWTTGQVLLACLWSTLLGIACGYAWLFLQAE
jgi:hypothetical protein